MNSMGFMGDINFLTLMKADKDDTIPQYNDYVVKYHWKGLSLLTGHTVTGHTLEKVSTMFLVKIVACQSWTVKFWQVAFRKGMT